MKRVEATDGKHIYESKPAGADGRVVYDAVEQQTWHYLVDRQNKILEHRATNIFLEGVHQLQLHLEIPQVQDVSKKLKAATGWIIEPVPAVIDAEAFFQLLANKKFPAANFIRIPEEIDYLQEPDIFHEVYGHCPLLLQPDYANFMQEYGKLALTVKGKERMRLFRLFWYTIEFGLIREADQYRIYGGGILSSYKESLYALDNPNVQRVPLDLLTCFRTPFRIDILQPLYFVIPSFNTLFELCSRDLMKTVKLSIELGDLPPAFEAKAKQPEIEKEYL